MAVTEFAPAKINLTLHVTGRRPDGYHLLDSLVVFADIGDWVSVERADDLRLAVTGPNGPAVPRDGDNLVLRAARSFQANLGAAITLEKHLPVTSGIGGGSADAAATLRALARLWNLPLPSPDTVLALGADVPVCLQGAPLRMRGVGENLTPAAVSTQAWLVLVNPGIAVATPAVFKALARRDHPPMGDIPALAEAADLAAFLHANRNDLEAPALQLAPIIAEAKAAIAAQTGCLIARMSGSGATCFGLFADQISAEKATLAVQATHPDWWVRAGKIL